MDVYDRYASLLTWWALTGQDSSAINAGKVLSPVLEHVVNALFAQLPILGGSGPARPGIRDERRDWLERCYVS